MLDFFLLSFQDYYLGKLLLIIFLTKKAIVTPQLRPELAHLILFKTIIELTI